ncbi:hypothetical protein MTO96_042767 [Rhipicephalus appendiculatus]
MLVRALEQVTALTIANCYRHCGFSTKALQADEPPVLEHGVTAPMADVLEDVCFADYVDVDSRCSATYEAAVERMPDVYFTSDVGSSDEEITRRRVEKPKRFLDDDDKVRPPNPRKRVKKATSVAPEFPQVPQDFPAPGVLSQYDLDWGAGAYQ